MDIYRSADFLKRQNQTPGEFDKIEILTEKNSAKDLGGLSVIIPHGKSSPYVYHKKREQVIFFLAGQATAVIEGKEVTLNPGDVLYTPAGEKHRIENRSNQDVRFLEFYTIPPWNADVVHVK
jgi:mannose-6-phosphate isomerase-like protein (cupin superfamily)